MGQSLRTEGMRRYIFKQFQTEECIQEGFPRGLGEQFQGNQFAVIHLRLS